MYTRVIGRPRTLRARHSVENQWDLLTALGIEPADREKYPVTMALAPDAVLNVETRLATVGVGPGHRLIVMHVSAGNPFRRWPVPAFAAVAARLAEDDDRHRIVVTSGPSERDAASAVIDAARADLNAVRAGHVLACGEFSLTELRALVERAALYIGGDSGPMHVAATSHVPMVSLYGPTLPARSAPWRAPIWPAEAVEVHGLACRPCEQRVCVPGDFRCLTRITPDDVVQAARRALGATDDRAWASRA
jgi:ADP-heptose:LPS heptosyltransferase